MHVKLILDHGTDFFQVGLVLFSTIKIRTLQSHVDLREINLLHFLIRWKSDPNKATAFKKFSKHLNGGRALIKILLFDTEVDTGRDFVLYFSFYLAKKLWVLNI